MNIVSFAFDSDLTHSFLEFGYELYRHDPRWIPPQRKILRAQFSPDFPFYRKPGNDHRHFLAMSSGRVVGRVSAMINGDLKDRDGTPVGCLGFFECVPDYRVARGLLDAACTWLWDRRHLSRIWAPVQFDIWHGYRFMTRGFNEKPFYGEPYNKPYYPGFLERYRFTPRQHWHSLEVRDPSTLEQMAARGASRYRQLLRKGYRFEPFDMDRFQDELGKLHGILSESFRRFLGITPISAEDFTNLWAHARYAFDPSLFTFVSSPDDKLAGFAGAFLDLGDPLRTMRGKDHSLARMRFSVSRSLVDRILFYLGGMTPEEEAKGSGLGRAGCSYILKGGCRRKWVRRTVPYGRFWLL